MLLIDEYDAPLHHAYTKDYYEEAIGFFRVFLSDALKGNPHLDFAVLTGILRVSKESIFSGLNNLRVCSILERNYIDKFGFTEYEVIALLDEQKERLDSAADMNISTLRSWYDGYKFGDRI